MKMDDPGWRFQDLVMYLVGGVVHLYPPRFRDEFSDEIRAVLEKRIREAEERGGAVWLAAIFQEITQLVISIVHERWHELRVRKEITMVPEDRLKNDTGAKDAGMPALQPAGTPGVMWLAIWTLLMTAAIPVAFIAMAPLAVMFLWLSNLGATTGLWPAGQQASVELLGALLGFALVLASVQWYLLRRFLPEARLWFMATGAGVLLGALVVGLSIGRSSTESWDPIWIMAAVLLPFGMTLGLAQWFYLRRILPNAFWIILIDTLAAGSILLVGGTITNALELMVLLLPGAITGLGLLLLLSQTHPKRPYDVQTEASRANDRWLPRLGRVGLGLAALVPLFFVCTWGYTASQLTLAKNEGIYSTPEEGMRAMAQKSYPTDHRVKILHAGPNSFDGSQPYMWYVIAEVRASSRADGSDMGANGCDNPGSFFLQTKEGWVHVSEGAFPEFIGYWMEVFGWAGEGQSTPSTDWAPGQSRIFCQ